MSFRAVVIQIIKATIPFQISGTVKSVDETKYTCVVTPDDGSEDFADVRLNAAISSDDSGMVTVPVVGSAVIISPIFHNDHAYFVSKFSKVKRWLLKTDSGKTIEIPETGAIELNGDALGGIPKKDALEQFADDLKTAIDAGFTAVGAGSAASGPTGKAAFDTAVTPFITAFKNNLQNTNVKHG